MNVLILVLVVFASHSWSEYTTIGRSNWFGDLIFRLEGKLKSKEAKRRLLRISYFKGLICRPCHTFWIILVILLHLYSYYVSIGVSFIGFFYAKLSDKRQE